MIKALITCYGDYEGIVEFKTWEQYWAYNEGLTKGASLFAGSDCGLYTIEDIMEGSEYANPSTEDEKQIRAMILQYLGPIPETLKPKNT